MNQTTKKPYSTPRLIVYGDVRTITRQNGTHAKDGGNNSVNSRT